MDELIQWTHSPACLALGRALLHSLWQGAALAGLLAVVNGKLGARARYGAACAALAALLISFGVTSVVSLEVPPPALISPPNSIAQGGVLPIAAGIVRTGVDWIPWLVPLWTAGVMLMSLRLAVGWLGARRLARLTGSPLPGHWQQAARALAARMRVKAPFRLLESARVVGPAVVGWLRPVILVPAGALCGLTAEQMEAVLAHELAHLARRDALVSLLESFAEVVLFYHPAAWWLLSRIRREREHCCDDLAVSVCGSARLYAEALLRLEEARPARRALVFAARDGDLIARIRRLLTPGTGERTEWRAALASLTGLLIVAAVVAAASAQQAAPGFKGPYQRWLDEDAAYIIQDWERREAASLKSEGEWKKFIADFWKRRNPHPGQGENLVKEEHYRRIAYANERFGESSLPGWKTARGRVYIFHGPPDEIVQHGGYEKWSYRSLPGAGNDVSFEFGLDQKPANSDQVHQEALQKQRDALQAQIDMLKSSLAQIRRQTGEQRARSAAEIENARQQVELLLEQIRASEGELNRVKAKQR